MKPIIKVRFRSERLLKRWSNLRRRIQNILKITQGENFENLNKTDRKFPSKGKGAFFCLTGDHSKNTHSIFKDFKNHILMIREISLVLLYDFGVYFSERFFLLTVISMSISSVQSFWCHFVTGLTRKKIIFIIFRLFRDWFESFVYLFFVNIQTIVLFN